MASCDNPEHAALESELNDALEEALQMEERLAAYEAAGAGAGGDLGAGGGGAAARALEEIATLTEQAATLEKERDAYEQDYLNQKDRVDNLETQLEDKDQKAKELVRARGGGVDVCECVCLLFVGFSEVWWLSLLGAVGADPVTSVFLDPCRKRPFAGLVYCCIL